MDDGRIGERIDTLLCQCTENALEVCNEWKMKNESVGWQTAGADHWQVAGVINGKPSEVMRG